MVCFVSLKACRYMVDLFPERQGHKRWKGAFGLKNRLWLPLWNAWFSKRQNFGLFACAWACITLLTHFLFQGGLDQFYFLRWVLANSTSSLCWVLYNSTSCFWETYEMTLHFSCWLIPMLTWTIRKSETVLCAMNIRCISEGVYSKYPLNFKPYTHTSFPVTKDGTKALFRVLGGKNNRCCWTTPYIRLTRYRGPMTSGGGSLCFNFFFNL